MTGAEQCAVGVKEVEDFAPRDGDAERSESHLKGGAKLVDGLVLGQTEVAKQQDDVETEGETGQGEAIGNSTAVRALGSRTVGDGAAVAAVDNP